MKIFWYRYLVLVRRLLFELWQMALWDLTVRPEKFPLSLVILGPILFCFVFFPFPCLWNYNPYFFVPQNGGFDLFDEKWKLLFSVQFILLMIFFFFFSWTTLNLSLGGRTLGTSWCIKKFFGFSKRSEVELPFGDFIESRL